MVDSKIPTMVLKRPPNSFIFDKTEDRWCLIEDITLEGEPTLILNNFFKKDEGLMTPSTIINRAKEMGSVCAGQLHAERILKQQKNIPVEWREFHLLFPGTVWCIPGKLYVPYLRWDSDRWFIYWFELSEYFDSRDHIVCLVV